jgi:hypothetical protein
MFLVSRDPRRLAGKALAIVLGRSTFVEGKESFFGHSSAGRIRRWGIGL